VSTCQKTAYAVSHLGGFAHDDRVKLIQKLSDF
jgi:hypothetical protein